MSYFRLEFDRLRISIANKARVTTNEADAYLNLQPLSEEADRSFQNHSASFTTEERRFINDIHRFSSNEIKLKESRDPIISAEQIKTQTEQNPSEKHAKLALLVSVPSSVPPKKLSPAKRTKNKDSTALDAYIMKHATKPNKDLLVLARKKFPDMDITIPSLKMRKTRLRNNSEG